MYPSRMLYHWAMAISHLASKVVTHARYCTVTRKIRQYTVLDRNYYQIILNTTAISCCVDARKQVNWKHISPVDCVFQVLHDDQTGKPALPPWSMHQGYNNQLHSYEVWTWRSVTRVNIVYCLLVLFKNFLLPLSFT